MNSTALIPRSNHLHNQLRNETVQQLKDILTELQQPEEFAETPAAGDDGGEAEATEEAAAETSEGHVDGEAGEDNGEEAENHGEIGDSEPVAPGSNVDQMDTLPFNGGDFEEWPPCPWIPKTSLRRWKKPKARFEQFLFLRV